MVNIINLNQIKDTLKEINLEQIIENGFAAYSRGDVIVPPVGELVFTDPPGDVHIKYGYIKDDDFFVIKIASGFYNNPKLGIPSSQGLMLVFSQETGIVEAILLDNGYLTDIRTAAAGAVVAKYLAPEKTTAIGILGAGIQGKLQLRHLIKTVKCKNAFVWTPDSKEINDYKNFFKNSDLNIEFLKDPRNLASRCNLIITTTPSRSPLLFASDIHSGTHITAVGSDTEDKIELDPAILGKADIVVSDSLAQSKNRGEIYQAVKAGTLSRENISELGNIISGKELSRQNDQQITIADLTGVAVQDIKIATAVYKNIKMEE